jgi:general secretion pathway protein A
MRYFELLNLRREPFSNSPDPELFYQTKQHRECLQALEIAIRLKRGLSVVTGHVGTGKTTLCRQLLRVLDQRKDVVTHLILDPTFSDGREFLLHLSGLFGADPERVRTESDWQLREIVKNALFKLAVEDGKLVALVVDEGQKISLECLEILRELLNYETNEHKLLQIVIFAQLEFEPILEAKANLADRVNLRFRLGPLDFQDTRELIEARLAMCAKDISPEGLFTFWGLLGVYLATDGFPRQIVQLCHQALLAVIIKERPRVTWGVVRSCMRWRTLGLPRRRRWPWAAAGTFALALALTGFFASQSFSPGDFRDAVGFVRMPDVGGWMEAVKAKFMRDAPPAHVPAAGPAQGAGQGPAVGPGAAGPEIPVPAADLQGAPPGQPQPAPGADGVAQPGGEVKAALAELAAQGQGAAAPSGEGSASPSPPASEGGPARFLGVRALPPSPDADGEVLEILLDPRPERFEVSYKPGPPRIVVDVFGRVDRKTGERELSVGSKRVDKIRNAIHPDKLRVAVYLKDAPAGNVLPGAEKTPAGIRLILK